MTIAPTDTGTSLALRPEQTTFDAQQRAVLSHMGVGDAPEEDLRVFAHVCQRSGLDPFARQVHMIGRDSSVKDSRGNWAKVTKYTIQTGIDGYRLIGRRAADQRGATISLSAPEWADNDGRWRPVWTGAWGTPLAARITILRDGHPFTATALFDEYAQTKRDGQLTAMWAQRPAGQLAKCAEALAWRMAFPQDLSGIYVDDEMHHADSAGGVQSPTVLTASDFQVAPTHAVPVDVTDAEVLADDGPATITPAQSRTMHAAFRDLGISDRELRLDYCRNVIGREIGSSKDLTAAEASRILAALAADTTT